MQPGAEVLLIRDDGGPQHRFLLCANERPLQELY